MIKTTTNDNRYYVADANGEIADELTLEQAAAAFAESWAGTDEASMFIENPDDANEGILLAWVQNDQFVEIVNPDVFQSAGQISAWMVAMAKRMGEL